MTGGGSPRKTRMTQWASRIWRGMREWSGDAAYERYLKSPAQRTANRPAMTREEFYLDQLQKRYSRVSRCC